MSKKHEQDKIIPYRKEYRRITGSVTGAILLQQLEYWFEKTGNKPFYKYLSPTEGANSWYRRGDSWTEELGFSEAEFRTAFSKIGVHYNSKSLFDEISDRFQGKFYASYTDRMSHTTYYIRNSQLVNRELGKLRDSIYEGQENQPGEGQEVIPEYTDSENTSENTYETNITRNESGDGEDEIVFYLYSAKGNMELAKTMAELFSFFKGYHVTSLHEEETPQPKHKRYVVDQPLTVVTDELIHSVHAYYCYKFDTNAAAYPLAAHHKRFIRARLKEYSLYDMLKAIMAARRSPTYNGSLEIEGSHWRGADLTWITKSNENMYKLAYEEYPGLFS